MMRYRATIPVLVRDTAADAAITRITLPACDGVIVQVIGVSRIGGIYLGWNELPVNEQTAVPVYGAPRSSTSGKPTASPAESTPVPTPRVIVARPGTVAGTLLYVLATSGAANPPGYELVAHILVTPYEALQ